MAQIAGGSRLQTPAFSAMFELPDRVSTTCLFGTGSSQIDPARQHSRILRISDDAREANAQRLD